MKMRIERTPVVATYQMMKDRLGDWWIGVLVDGKPHDKLGPFRTREECNAAFTDVLSLAKAIGAVDQPAGGH